MEPFRCIFKDFIYLGRLSWTFFVDSVFCRFLPFAVVSTGVLDFCWIGDELEGF